MGIDLLLATLPDGDKAHTQFFLTGQLGYRLALTENLFAARHIRLGQLTGEPVAAACRNGTVDTLEERLGAEDIQVERIGMMGIEIGRTVFENREVALQISHLMLVCLTQVCNLLRLVTIRHIHPSCHPVEQQQQQGEQQPPAPATQRGKGHHREQGKDKEYQLGHDQQSAPLFALQELPAQGFCTVKVLLSDSFHC